MVEPLPHLLGAVSGPATISALERPKVPLPEPTLHKAVVTEPSHAETGIKQLVGIQLLYAMAIAISVPAFPFVWTVTPLADGDDVRGGSLHSYGVTVNAACELLSASLLGTLSDHFGRKPFLLAASVGQVIDFTVAGLAARGGKDCGLSLPHSHIWLFLARGLAGLCGNMMVFSKACVGDVSSPEQRARNFALLGSTIGIAFVIGPAVGAGLAAIHLQVPLLVSAGLSVVSLSWICCLKETLRQKDVVALHWRRANPFGALQFLYSTTFLRLFGAMSFLDQLALTVVSTIFLQYLKVAFGVDREKATSVLVVFGLGQGISCVLILPPLVRRLGEASTLKLGYVLTTFAFACMGAASNIRVFWLMYPIVICFALGAISNPVQIAIGSNCVDGNAQGKLQAACGSLDVVGKMIGASIVSLVWEPTTRAGQPGAIWWLACAAMGPGVWIAFRLARSLPPRFQHPCDEGGNVGTRSPQIGGTVNDGGQSEI